MIILLNGSINAGKSTVAALVAERLGNTAIVEIDALRAFIDWMPIEQAVPIVLEAAANVIRAFVKQGLSVVVPYPLSEANYKYLQLQFESLGVEIRAFTLAPRLDVAIKDRGTRPLSAWEQERIKHHYDIGIPAPTFGIVIDNSDETPEQTAERILASLE